MPRCRQCEYVATKAAHWCELVSQDGPPVDEESRLGYWSVLRVVPELARWNEAASEWEAVPPPPEWIVPDGWECSTWTMDPRGDDPSVEIKAEMDAALQRGPEYFEKAADRSLLGFCLDDVEDLESQPRPTRLERFGLHSLEQRLTPEQRERCAWPESIRTATVWGRRNPLP